MGVPPDDPRIAALRADDAATRERSPRDVVVARVRARLADRPSLRARRPLVVPPALAMAAVALVVVMRRGRADDVVVPAALVPATDPRSVTRPAREVIRMNHNA